VPQAGRRCGVDPLQLGRIKGVGRVYLHVVVDTLGSYAFSFLHTSKQPEAAVAVLHNDVLSFYAEHEITVQTLLTDNGCEYCGTDSHPYELYLQLNDIEHRTTRVRRPQTNGFVERFNRTGLDEFIRTAFRTTFYESVEQLQADLDQWMVFYNTERPHHGYRNMGKRPMDTVEQYLRQHQETQTSDATASAGQTAVSETQPGAQPVARAKSAATLDTGEYLAMMELPLSDRS
jgi:hypothetical protein